jgi:hypothetical protein
MSFLAIFIESTTPLSKSQYYADHFLIFLTRQHRIPFMESPLLGMHQPVHSYHLASESLNNSPLKRDT